MYSVHSCTMFRLVQWPERTKRKENISPLCTVYTHVLCLDQCSDLRGPRGRRTALHYVQCTLMYHVQISVVVGKDQEEGEHICIMYSVHSCTIFRSVLWPERTQRKENISPLCTLTRFGEPSPGLHSTHYVKFSIDICIFHLLLVKVSLYKKKIG